MALGSTGCRLAAAVLAWAAAVAAAAETAPVQRQLQHHLREGCWAPPVPAPPLPAAALGTDGAVEISGHDACSLLQRQSQSHKAFSPDGPTDTLDQQVLSPTAAAASNGSPILGNIPIGTAKTNTSGNASLAANTSGTPKTNTSGNASLAANTSGTAKMNASGNASLAANRTGTAKMNASGNASLAANATGTAKLNSGEKQPNEMDAYTSAAGYVWDALNYTKKAVLANPTQRNTSVPSGSSIWSENVTWVTVREWHPVAGVISNIKDGAVEWADVSFMSYKDLLVLTIVAYPALCVIILLLLVFLVSLCLAAEEAEDTFTDSTGGVDASKALAEAGGATAGAAASAGDSGPGAAGANGSMAFTPGIEDPLYDPPVLPKEHLTEFSRGVYTAWAFFCCLIPSVLVFGVPCLMIGLARPFPQEVFAALTLVTSAFIFSNGIYMAIFAGTAIARMTRYLAVDSNAILGKGESARKARQVMHWVLLPQYKEDVEVVAMALKSIGSSKLARSSIGVVLGMEGREGEDAKEKAEILKTRFQSVFREVLVTMHPPNLPNDPPGKASNLAWAFKQLMLHLTQNGRDMSGVVLTIADADSEFSHGYFETLSRMYLEAGESQRDLRIWQSPVFHVKNYHYQPMPVVVGTMFTCMQELAALNDPNAVRFPYSTYSLSLSLARRVGGWDADWIAEDYHMGIKCFLLTLGQTKVEPILLPTVNYTPEGDTWLERIYARWSQAKRHALGFSDLAYYFMMLPLIFSYAGRQGKGIHTLKAFWSMTMYGLTLLIRLINIHVLIGIFSTYGICSTLLKLIMVIFFPDDRHAIFLFNRTKFCIHLLMGSSVMLTVFVSVLFMSVYSLMKKRIDGEREFWFHWLRNALCIIVFGPFYFFGLGFAIWKAALNVACSRSFEYEVAPKPKLKGSDDCAAAGTSSTAAPVFGGGAAGAALGSSGAASSTIGQ